LQKQIENYKITKNHKKKGGGTIFKITHIGAEKCVTGSCHLLQTCGLNILIDCGITQGSDKTLPITRWPVKPSDIHFLFLTHAHIDHIGRVPELIQEGFTGEILCTHGTKALAGPMLEDALEFTSYHSDEKKKILSDIEEMTWGFEYGESFNLKNGIGFSLGRAGHILGSCWIRFDLEGGSSIVFSGDIGAKNTPILPDPDIPEPCDLLVMESTYGDKNHENRTTRWQRLGELLSKALADSGKVLIPAFALGRTQELIYEMDRLFSGSHKTSLKSKIPVFIDSPLGLKITKIYSKLTEYWDKEAIGLLQQGDHPIDFNHLYSVEQYTEHVKLLEYPGPAIIVAGSGMCNGGRIIEHLKHNIGNPKTDIFFVGYQARGTLGKRIIECAGDKDGQVLIDERYYPVRAAVYRLTGYSAHADQQELLAWAKAIRPGHIKLVHGEPMAQKALKTKISLMR
jgi:metallo-beta-lactamase family protein